MTRKVSFAVLDKSGKTFENTSRVPSKEGIVEYRGKLYPLQKIKSKKAKYSIVIDAKVKSNGEKTFLFKDLSEKSKLNVVFQSVIFDSGNSEYLSLQILEYVIEEQDKNNLELAFKDISFRNMDLSPVKIKQSSYYSESRRKELSKILSKIKLNTINEIYKENYDELYYDSSRMYDVNGHDTREKMSFEQMKREDKIDTADTVESFYAFSLVLRDKDLFGSWNNDVLKLKEAGIWNVSQLKNTKEELIMKILNCDVYKARKVIKYGSLIESDMN